MADRVIKPDSGNQLVLQDEGGSASLTVETDGDVKLNQDIYLSAGKGIYFDGGTTAANYLGGSDAYEEGLYTVALTTSGGGTISVNSSFNQIGYVRIGSIVNVGGQLRTDGTLSGSDGVLYISLPFAVKSLSEEADMWTGSLLASNVNFDTVMQVNLCAIESTSVCAIYQTSDNAAYSQLFGSSIASGDRFGIGLTYQTT